MKWPNASTGAAKVVAGSPRDIHSAVRAVNEELLSGLGHLARNQCHDHHTPKVVRQTITIFETVFLESD